MNKKVLILSSSPRKGGNSETLAAAFAKGALEAGNLVETVHLREKNYGFCRGCLACQKLGHCVIRDDAVEVTAKMHDADVLVFATPVYYYSVSGQLKTMLDRANPLYDTDYAFTKAYLLATAAEDEPETVDGTRTAVQGWVDCFPRCELAETVVLLSKGEVDSKKIRVEFSLEDMDMSEFQDGATYPQIKEYVLEHTGLKVSNLYISQIKRKCGIGVGKNYNLPKSEDSRQPQCPQEKEKAIREAFKYFGMI